MKEKIISALNYCLKRTLLRTFHHDEGRNGNEGGSQEDTMSNSRLGWEDIVHNRQSGEEGCAEGASQGRGSGMCGASHQGTFRWVRIGSFHHTCRSSCTAQSSTGESGGFEEDEHLQLLPRKCRKCVLWFFALLTRVFLCQSSISAGKWDNPAPRVAVLYEDKTSCFIMRLFELLSGSLLELSMTYKYIRKYIYWIVQIERRLKIYFMGWLEKNGKKREKKEKECWLGKMA